MVKFLILIIIFAIRFAGVTIMFFVNPLVGILINLIIDSLDGPIYKHILKIDPLRAQYYDKVWDFIYYIFLFARIYDMNLVVFPILLVTFVYRMVGQIIFYVTANKRVLSLFLNFFEYFAIGFLLIHEINPDYLIPQLNWIIPMFLVLFLFKSWHEFFLHKYNKTLFDDVSVPLLKKIYSRLL